MPEKKLENKKSGVKRVHDVASRMRLYGNMIVRNKYPIFKKVYGGVAIGLRLRAGGCKSRGMCL